jgi:hypothetical protein
VDPKAQVDTWTDVSILATVAEGGVWDAADDLGENVELEPEPDAKGSFDELPAVAAQPKRFAAWTKELATSLYRTRTLSLRRSVPLGLVAKTGESEGDFKVRVGLAAREARDAAIAALRKKYAAKLEAIAGREQRAADKVAREQAQASQQTLQTAISVGATVLGALFGRKALSTATLGRASTAARGVSRTMKEREDVGGASEGLDAVRASRAAIEAELQAEIERLTSGNEADQAAIETTEVRPRKSDISVDDVSLVWDPYWVGEDGSARPAR